MDFDGCLALIWADFGYVLAMFPYVKPAKIFPGPSPDLPPSIWGQGEIRWDRGGDVGRSLCAIRLYPDGYRGGGTLGSPIPQPRSEST
jgi:hypothetical protein